MEEQPKSDKRGLASRAEWEPPLRSLPIIIRSMGGKATFDAVMPAAEDEGTVSQSDEETGPST